MADRYAVICSNQRTDVDAGYEAMAARMLGYEREFHREEREARAPMATTSPLSLTLSPASGGEGTCRFPSFRLRGEGTRQSSSPPPQAGEGPGERVFRTAHSARS